MTYQHPPTRRTDSAFLKAERAQDKAELRRLLHHVPSDEQVRKAVAWYEGGANTVGAAEVIAPLLPIDLGSHVYTRRWLEIFEGITLPDYFAGRYGPLCQRAYVYQPLTELYRYFRDA